MKKKIVAIQSVKTEEAIGNALRSRREIYYLVYRLAIETGMNVQYILNLKVSDVRNTRTFFIPSKNIPKGSGVQETISDSLYNDLQNYVKDRADNEWFALNLNESNNINPSTMQKNLASVVQELSLDGIGLSSFRKTYLYHKILTGMPINIIRKQLDLPSNDAVYAHLGITGNDYDIHTVDFNNIAVDDNPSIIYYLRKKINRNLQYILDCIVDKTLYGESVESANAFAKDLLDAVNKFDLPEDK